MEEKTSVKKSIYVELWKQPRRRFDHTRPPKRQLVYESWNEFMESKFGKTNEPSMRPIIQFYWVIPINEQDNFNEMYSEKERTEVLKDPTNTTDKISLLFLNVRGNIDFVRIYVTKSDEPEIRKFINKQFVKKYLNYEYVEDCSTELLWK